MNDNYLEMWKILRLNVKYWYNTTDEEKETNEKKLYADLLAFMNDMEKKLGGTNEGQDN